MATKKKKKYRIRKLRVAVAVLFLSAVILAGVLIFLIHSDSQKSTETLTETTEETGGETAEGGEPAETGETGSENGIEDSHILPAVTDPEPEATPDPYEVTEFNPTHTEETKPSRMMEYTNIQVDGESVKRYRAETPIEFGLGRDYTQMEGVLTFRGNNFRDAPAYGTAPMSRYKMKKLWSVHTGSMTISGQYWSGNGWTGQPLLIRWPAETKQFMNMYDWAKADDDLVEAIHASLDGNIYFTDIRSGKPTRDTMKTGFVFKGAGALDPRGYPILYVGSGYNSPAGTSRAFIINLLDCSVMYEYGCVDPFSLRGSLSFFDSSTLVDAETDTLISPGENGILYLIKLNTNYNAKKGKLSIHPGPIVKWRYKGRRNSGGSYWYGMEDSAAVYQGYLFIADNGGHLMCLDLNTLRLKWVQDILDDSNSTPVLSAEDGKLYLYVSTSFHLGWRSSSSAEIPIWKIDASDGSVVWKTSYTCHSVEGNSGGVQSTIAVGHRTLDNYIYVTVSKTDSLYNGVLVALKKKNGKKPGSKRAPTPGLRRFACIIPMKPDGMWFAMPGVIPNC